MLGYQVVIELGIATAVHSWPQQDWWNVQVTEDLRQLAEQQERLNVHFQPQLAELQAQQQGLEGLQQAEAAQREALAQAQDMVQHLSQVGLYPPATSASQTHESPSCRL